MVCSDPCYIWTYIKILCNSCDRGWGFAYVMILELWFMSNLFLWCTIQFYTKHIYIYMNQYECAYINHSFYLWYNVWSPMVQYEPLIIKIYKCIENVKTRWDNKKNFSLSLSYILYICVYIVIWDWIGQNKICVYIVYCTIVSCITTFHTHVTYIFLYRCSHYMEIKIFSMNAQIIFYYNPL